MLTLKLARFRPTNEIIHVDIASNGLSCNCVCVECGEALEARQGNERAWHFKHHKNLNCLGAQPTALHELGKQILISNSGKQPIAIPDYGAVKYWDAVPEKALGSKRPDVTASFAGGKIYFEVAVTHFVEPAKEEFLKTGKHSCVEIDLNELENESYDRLQQIIIEEVDNKRVLFWEKDAEEQDISKWIWRGILFVAGFFFLRWLGKKIFK